jgi:hypothetical protein
MYCACCTWNVTLEVERVPNNASTRARSTPSTRRYGAGADDAVGVGDGDRDAEAPALRDGCAVGLDDGGIDDGDGVTTGSRDSTWTGRATDAKQPLQPMPTPVPLTPTRRWNT